MSNTYRRFSVEGLEKSIRVSTSRLRFLMRLYPVTACLKARQLTTPSSCMEW